MKKSKAKSVKNNPQTLEKALIAFRYALTSALTSEAKARGCGLSHFEVLKYISEQGSPSMKQIASQLHITPPSVSALVDGLAAKGLILRSQIPEDRRTIRITLSPKGQVFLFSVHKRKVSIFNKMLSKLNNNDKNELARILIKCISI